MKQLSFPCSCIICQKSTSSLGIDTHFMRTHGSDEDKAKFQNAALSKQIAKEQRKLNYNKNPSFCEKCNSILPYDIKNNKYCSHSCAASSSNVNRNKSSYQPIVDKLLSCSACSAEHLVDRRTSHYVCIDCKLLKGGRLKKQHAIEKNESPKILYSKLYNRNCKFCKNIFTTGSKAQVCRNCQHLKWKNGKDNYSFNFNVFHYPDLFDLDNLKEVGWVSFGGKRGKYQNMNGLSRDHKVSVHDAKLNKYDPYYISHPMNCELIPHHQNNKKNTNSSISYEELVRLVDDYDSTKG